jgi:hypothetical protein
MPRVWVGTGRREKRSSGGDLAVVVHGVGLQNSATGPGLGFYAARPYSWMSLLGLSHQQLGRYWHRSRVVVRPMPQTPVVESLSAAGPLVIDRLRIVGRRTGGLICCLRRTVGAVTGSRPVPALRAAKESGSSAPGAQPSPWTGLRKPVGRVYQIGLALLRAGEQQGSRGSGIRQATGKDGGTSGCETVRAHASPGRGG